jgi:hypothetical protein
MKDDVMAFVEIFAVDEMMLELGRVPEKTQSIRTKPLDVLADDIASSVPSELSEKMHDVIDGAWSRAKIRPIVKTLS